MTASITPATQPAASHCELPFKELPANLVATLFYFTLGNSMPHPGAEYNEDSRELLSALDQQFLSNWPNQNKNDGIYSLFLKVFPDSMETLPPVYRPQTSIEGSKGVDLLLSEAKQLDESAEEADDDRKEEKITISVNEWNGFLELLEIVRSAEEETRRVIAAIEINEQLIKERRALYALSPTVHAEGQTEASSSELRAKQTQAGTATSTRNASSRRSRRSKAFRSGDWW